MKVLKVFLVDDDKIFVFLAKRIIAETKIETEVIVFGNGLEAIDYLKEIKAQPELLPDIILLDLNMPVMDGWEFLDEYIDLGIVLKKQVPIYVVSSSISPLDIEKAKNIDIVSDYIFKPIYMETVKGLIGKLLA